MCGKPEIRKEQGKKQGSFLKLAKNRRILPKTCKFIGKAGEKQGILSKTPAARVPTASRSLLAQIQEIIRGGTGEFFDTCCAVSRSEIRCSPIVVLDGRVRR